MLAGRIAQLAADCGVDAGGRRPLEQLRQLAEAAGAAAGRARPPRGDPPAVAAARRRRGAAWRRPPAGCSTAAAQLFREAGADDEQEFRRRAVESARAEVLRRDREALDREIAAAIGRPLLRRSRSAGSSKATRPPAWRPAASEARTALAAVEQDLRERLEDRGQLAEQMKALAEDRQLARKQLDWPWSKSGWTRRSAAGRCWPSPAASWRRSARPTSTSGSRKPCARPPAIWIG